MMKQKTTIVMGLAMAMSLISGTSLMSTAHAADAPELKTEKDKVSYSMGMNIGGAWKRQEMDMDIDLVAKGMKDALSGEKTALTEEEARGVMMEFQKSMRTKQEEKRKSQGEANLKEGLAFLEKNKSEPGVTVLPDGLQYKVLKEGDGPMPKITERVSVHYRGTLINGEEFDSSYKRNQPSQFAVAGVIKGWTEALQLMKVGSKWQIFVPQELAYGDKGSGMKIGPKSVLIFEMELLGIMPGGAPSKPVTSDIVKVPSAEELKKGAQIEILKQNQPDRTK